MKTISRYIMTLALLLTAVGGAWAQSTYTVTFKANGNTKTVENVTLPHTFELDPIIIELYPSLSGGNGSPAGTSASGNTNVTAYYTNNKHYATISASFEGAVTVTGQFYKDYTNNQYTLEINCMENLVAISDDKTEATIKMPTSDVTIDYELVRDMSVQMQAQVGDDHAKQPRYRVQWNGERWVPADMEYEEVLELFSVYDGIEGTTLAPKNYLVNIWAVDDEGKPTGNAMDFTNFTFAPGRYYVTASPNTQLEEPVPYEGTTAPSNIFELFQGYEVTVPAGEYATFYKDENLYTEDEDAVLYTIANVTDTEAQLSDAIKVAPAETPLLVYNKSEQAKTFLLIPTTDDAPEVTHAKEFMGSVSSEELPASSSTADYYVLNGKAFVWVKGTINIGANKCWLQINNQLMAGRATTRSITGGGDTTGINAIDSEQLTDDNYYDLNGRKVEKPNRKGIYIHNGQKVVVR